MGRFSREVVVSLRTHSRWGCVSLLGPACSNLISNATSISVCVCAFFRLQVHLPCSLPRSGAPGLPAQWEINGLPRSTWHLRSVLQQRPGNSSRVPVITAFPCQLCNEVWSAYLAQLRGKNVSLRHGQHFPPSALIVQYSWVRLQLAAAGWVTPAPINFQINWLKSSPTKRYFSSWFVSLGLTAGTYGRTWGQSCSSDRLGHTMKQLTKWVVTRWPGLLDVVPQGGP